MQSATNMLQFLEDIGDCPDALDLEAFFVADDYFDNNINTNLCTLNFTQGGLIIRNTHLNIQGATWASDTDCLIPAENYCGACAPLYTGNFNTVPSPFPKPPDAPTENGVAVDFFVIYPFPPPAAGQCRDGSAPSVNGGCPEGSGVYRIDGGAWKPLDRLELIPLYDQEVWWDKYDYYTCTNPNRVDTRAPFPTSLTGTITIDYIIELDEFSFAETISYNIP